MALATPALTTCREAIADTVEAITDLGLVGFGYTTEGGTGYPFAFLEHEASEDLGQHHTWTDTRLNLYVLYGQASDAQEANERMDRSLTGSAAVAPALRADPTFGGTCVTSIVSSGARTLYRDHAGYISWGMQWELRVLLAA